MTTTLGHLLLWAPRLLGILVTLFIGLFALDAFDGRGVIEALPAFAVHLIPAFVLLALVVASWRWPWIGAVGFIGLAVYYAGVMSRGRVDWIVAISGPLFVVGVLFMASWIGASRLRES